MPSIISIGTYVSPYRIDQEEALVVAKQLFENSFTDVDRRLQVFRNGQIEHRYFSVPLPWFEEEHTFQEKNDTYIRLATQFGAEAITDCLQSTHFLKRKIVYEEIDAIYFISSTGISTPSIEARIMNKLSFSPHTKRIPIWGLGCAGGVAGLARASEFCLAYPKAKVLVLSVELCSLTFQRKDYSKSNLVGASLFADGVACALVVGDHMDVKSCSRLNSYPKVTATQSTLLAHSEEVMGWDVQDQGLRVIFSKDIPQLVQKWFRPNVEQFLAQKGLTISDIQHFVAHPGGKKVLEAYQEALCLPKHMTQPSRTILKEYGNMSSATVLYVLKQVLQKEVSSHDVGIVAALGPGFSSELLLLNWSEG